MLKRLMIGAALAAVLATPAFAQAYYGGAGSGNIVSPNGAPVSAGTPAYVGGSAKAYAHVPPAGGYSTPGFNAFAYQPRARRGDATINDQVYQPGGSYWREMQRQHGNRY
jgi:hypothetical protein